MKSNNLADKGPQFRPEDYLVGYLEGWAIFESLFGTRRATITAEGKLDFNTAHVLFVETWTFEDGLVDTLSWEIRNVGDGRYKGREPRVKEEAEGERRGSAYHWSYARDIPRGPGRSILLTFDDWFYQIDKRVCIVKGRASKFGFPIGAVHVTYRKL